MTVEINFRQNAIDATLNAKRLDMALKTVSDDLYAVCATKEGSYGVNYLQALGGGYNLMGGTVKTIAVMSLSEAEKVAKNHANGWGGGYTLTVVEARVAYHHAAVRLREAAKNFRMMAEHTAA